MSMSSPRQKMVVMATPQPNEVEQRKKRQTLERAKANHLSKQLQMRLQYAKLKVEHGWQRQNLNEVENLYFHHSHQRSIRQSVSQRPQHPPAQTGSAESGLVGVSDRMSTSAHDVSCPSGSVPPPEHAASSNGPSPQPALDLSDPNILARLAQLHAQAQQGHSQTLSRHLTAQPAPTPVPGPLPIPALGAFSLHTQPPTGHPQPASAFAPQPHLFGSPPPSSVLLYPIAAPTPVVHITNPASTAASQPPASVPVPTPTPTSIAPTALTYDSFWSTHASSTGPTRALYRTHTGFTASAAPGGNVAMLTPGGHAAVMTAEGVYVGGAGK